MLKKQLGTSDLNITPIGFGAWAIGGGNWAFGWGAQDDAESIATIHEAIELGINWIDTAAVYGLGHSEEVVAQALEGVPQNDRPYIFSKCGRVWGEERVIGKNLKAESIRQECENSLRRLNIDVLDLYQIHWPEPIEDIEEGWQTMLKLKEEGKARYVGVSNFNVKMMERIRKFGPITSLQPPYSLIKRDIEQEILPYCEQHSIGTLIYSPMASGLLTGAWTHERLATLPDDDWRREKGSNFQEPNFTHNLKLVELLREIGMPHAKSPGEVAIAWVLRNPNVTAAIVGARKVGQLSELVPAAEMVLREDEVARIESFIESQPA